MYIEESFDTILNIGYGGYGTTPPPPPPPWIMGLENRPWTKEVTYNYILKHHEYITRWQKREEGFISNIAVYPHTEIAGEKYAKVAQNVGK